MKNHLMVAVLLSLCIKSAFSTADGPDYYRVRGIEKGDVLNIRAKPSAGAKIVGIIPPEGGCIENLFELWPPYYGDVEPDAEILSDNNLTEKEKVALSTGNIWTKIRYKGTEGWVRLKFLTEDEDIHVEEKREEESDEANESTNAQSGVPPDTGSGGPRR